MTRFSFKLSIASLTSLFSRNRQQQLRNVKVLQMDRGLSSNEFPGATELTYFKDDSGPADHLSYTSLRDLMPTSRPPSPLKCKRERLVGKSREEIDEDDVLMRAAVGDRAPIKNRLVERAARAYLLPSREQRTPSNQFFARYWTRLTNSCLQSDHRNSSSELLEHLSMGRACGCSHGCFCCLPGLLWVDFTRAFRSLFTHLRPQAFLRL